VVVLERLVPINNGNPTNEMINTIKIKLANAIALCIKIGILESAARHQGYITYL